MWPRFRQLTHAYAACRTGRPERTSLTPPTRWRSEGQPSVYPDSSTTFVNRTSVPTPMPNVPSNHSAFHTSSARMKRKTIAAYRNHRWTFWRISGNDASPRYDLRGSPTAHEGGSAQNDL